MQLRSLTAVVFGTLIVGGMFGARADESRLPAPEVVTRQEPESDAESRELRHFLLIGTPTPATLQKALATPGDFGVAARKELEGLGGQLIGYYFAVEHAKNYAIMALPGSKDMAALVYQRMATGAMLDIEVVELIPSDKMIDVFKMGATINETKKE